MALAEVAKLCPRCKITRAGQCFGRDKSRRDGLDEYCRFCRQEMAKETGKCRAWYARDGNRDRVIARNRERRIAGKPPRKRPRRMLHLAGPDSTICGWPKESKRYDVRPFGAGIDPNDEGVCRRCVQALNVLNECRQMTAEEIAEASRARSADILTRAARRNSR